MIYIKFIVSVHKYELSITFLFIYLNCSDDILTFKYGDNIHYITYDKLDVVTKYSLVGNKTVLWPYYV